jgi:hypothetical protein
MNIGAIVSASIFWVGALCVALVWRDASLAKLAMAGVGLANVAELFPRLPGMRVGPVVMGALTVAYAIFALR